MKIFSNHVAENFIYSAKECDEIAAQVRRLQEFWKARKGFFTLGASSYLDLESYAAEVPGRNRILLQNFGKDFYQDLAQRLKKVSGDEFTYLDQISYPGFHIFPGTFTAHAHHFDLNYQHVNWPHPRELDFDQLGSLTVALQIPSIGAGISIWPDWDMKALESKKAAFYFQNSKIENGELVPTTEPEKTEYKKGYLYSFGPVMHQVSPRSHQKEDELRITLQAHSVWHRDGHWILYW